MMSKQQSRTKQHFIFNRTVFFSDIINLLMLLFGFLLHQEPQKIPRLKQL